VSTANLLNSIRRLRARDFAFGVAVLLFAGCTAPPPVDTSPVTPNSDGTVSTVAGTGDPGFAGDGARGTLARLSQPMDVALASTNALLIADFGNHRIRLLSLENGEITTIAGDGESDTPASLPAPCGVTPRAGGGWLAVSWSAHRVEEFATDGSKVRTWGTGFAECAEGDVNTNATAAPLHAPRSAAVMADGSVLVSEQGCHRVRRFRGDSIADYAGNGAAGYVGDNGPAVDAALQATDVADGPAMGIFLSPEDPPDELFIADTGNHVIRQVKLFTGRMETLAGTGAPGFVDGPPENAQFNRPTQVYSGRDHSVWIVDSGNHAIRHIDPLGTRVTTVVGTGVAGFNGDGRAPLETQLNNPSAVWVTPNGWVFVADAGNHRVRLFQLATALATPAPQ